MNNFQFPSIVWIIGILVAFVVVAAAFPDAPEWAIAVGEAAAVALIRMIELLVRREGGATVRGSESTGQKSILQQLFLGG